MAQLLARPVYFWLALAAMLAAIALTAAQALAASPASWLPWAALLCLAAGAGSLLLLGRHGCAQMADALQRGSDAEQIIARLRSDLQRHSALEQELVQAKQAAEAAVLAKGEFFATMSHEIRTPLNGIVPMLDLLLDAQLPSTEHELVRTAYVSSQQLLRIVDDILDYSKLEAERLALESTVFNLREQAETVLRPLQRPAESKGLQLQLQIDPTVRLPVRGDPVRLRQVLSNLIGNAVKFTERGGITLSVRKLSETATQHRLRFEVRDTGIGISPGARQTLFKPFQQADSSTTRLYGGTGLGLAICKRIVELMGGQIGVESQPGRGSTFWFEIPLLKVQGDMAMPSEALSGSRVLLVTSDPRLQARLQSLLPQWGVRLNTVGNTQEALAQLRSGLTQGGVWTYRIVLADLNTVRTTALGLQRNLQRQPAYANLRLVLLAGDEPAPAGLQPGTPILNRQAPDADLQAVLAAYPDTVAPATHIADTAQPETSAPFFEEARAVRVLLVEDNPVNLMVAQRLLSVLGVENDAAGDGQAALQQMSAKQYDMVLMDCQMPVMDGYQATRHWREHERASNRPEHLPIVAMTANAMAGDRQKCLDAGMDDYLSKPVTRIELERCLHRWTRLRAGAGAGAANAAATEAQPAVPPSAVPLYQSYEIAEPQPRALEPLAAQTAAAFTVAPAAQPVAESIAEHVTQTEAAAPASTTAASSPGPSWSSRSTPRFSVPAPAPAPAIHAPPAGAFGTPSPPPVAMPPAPPAGTSGMATPSYSTSPAESAAMALPTSEAVLDADVLIELQGLLGEELPRLIAVFLDDAPKLIAKLEAAAFKPDLPALQQAAHTLKSSSANLGAMALSKAALAIEMGVRQGNLQRPAVAVAMLSQEFARARAGLMRWLPPA